MSDLAWCQFVERVLETIETNRDKRAILAERIRHRDAYKLAYAERVAGADDETVRRLIVQAAMNVT